MKLLRAALLSASLVSAATCYSQHNWGGKVGISFQFGSHIQRLGLMYQLYVYNAFAQLSQAAYIHYNFRNLGPRGGYFEAKFHFGFLAHWLEGSRKKYFFNEVYDMSPYRNALGYSLYAYRDGISLSQTTGAFVLQADAFQFVFDNDVFGFSSTDDKFRTGGFYAAYSIDSTAFGIQNTLWTGKSSDGKRIINTPYPGRNGYRDVSAALHGGLSHGILAARAEMVLDYHQTLRAEAGIDSEHIRHFFQNKLIHDVISGRLV